MDLLILLLTGLVIGALAKFLMPGDDPGGIIVTTLLGIAGAFVGGFASSAVGLEMGGVGNMLAAIAGAMLLLAGYRVVAGKR